MSKRVCIIGAGASGLAAIKICLEDGLNPICYELSNDIGGLWRYEEGDKDGASVYKSTIVNTSKEFMCFSTFPVPKHFPNYMHNTKIMEYFRMFSKEFGLESHIEFYTKVLSCKQTEDHERTGKWCVTTKNVKTEVENSQVFDGIIVAVGLHAVPNLPLNSFQGIEKFKGRYMHSRSYRTYAGMEGKIILVVGFGNSGGDISVELSRVAKQTFLSTSTGCWIWYRVDNDGFPLDVVRSTRWKKYKRHILPERYFNYAAENEVNKRFNHELYSLRPKHRIFSQFKIPNINDDLPNRVLSGTLKVKGSIQNFTENGVIFKDGEYQDVDVVIFATGYKFSYPFLDESIVKVEDNSTRLYKFIWPPNVKKSTLAIVGGVQPIGAINPVSEMQCRWITRVFRGLTKLPSKQEMNADIDKMLYKTRKPCDDMPRKTTQVDYINYLDDIANEIGVKPNMVKLIFTDPFLARKVLFEVASPYQYRLSGPGKWSKAREMIMTQMDRIRYPLQSRPSVAREQHPQFAWTKHTLCVLVFCTMLYQILWLNFK